MGRGLSELQVWILRECATHGVVFKRDIKARYYGWQPLVLVKKKWIRSKGRLRVVRETVPDDYERVVASPRTLAEAGQGGSGDRIFTRKHVGPDTYNRVSVAITKSIDRLRRRGLADWETVYIDCGPPEYNRYGGHYDYLVERGLVLFDPGKAYVRERFGVEPVEIPASGMHGRMRKVIGYPCFPKDTEVAVTAIGYPCPDGGTEIAVTGDGLSAVPVQTSAQS